MVDAYKMGALDAHADYGLSDAVDRFVAGLEDSAAPAKAPKSVMPEERAIAWTDKGSLGETGLATGFGTGMPAYGGV